MDGTSRTGAGASNMPGDVGSLARWDASIRALFPEGVPLSAEWTRLPEIISVLNHIARYPGNYNHTFMPSSGGLDLVGARLSNEKGCIELLFDGIPYSGDPDVGSIYVLRPGKLSFHGHGPTHGVPHILSYFRLEAAPLPATDVYDSEEEDEGEAYPIDNAEASNAPVLKYEELTEIYPGEYVERACWDYSEYQGGPLPKGARLIHRYLGGVFVTFAKKSPYNTVARGEFDAYDGYQDQLSERSFDVFIESLMARIPASYGSA